MIRLEVKMEGFWLEFDKKHLRSVMRAAGGEIAAAARRMIRRSSGSGRFYNYKGHRGARYQASAPGQPPVDISGALSKSIKVRPFKSGEGVAVRDNAFYAKFLEFGAKGGGGNTRDRSNILLAGEIGRGGRVLRGQNRMKAGAISKTRVLAPRPFLTAALDQRRASITTRIEAAIIEGMKFQRAKP